MKKKIFFIVMVILLAMPKQKLQAQASWRNNNRNKQVQSTFRNLFFHKTFIMPDESSDSVRVIIFSKIANDLMQFIMKDTLYTAQYELTVVFRNTQGESVTGQIKRRKISVGSFAETNVRNRFTREQFDFHLPSGEYALFIELLDCESEQPFRKNEKIVLPDFFSKPFTTTNILFFHEGDEDAILRKESFPEFPVIHSLSDSTFYAKFFICSDGSPRNVRLKQTILNRNNQPVTTDSMNITLHSRIQPVRLGLNKKFTFGQYTLSISMNDENTKIKLESPFYVRWKMHSTSLPHLSLAVETHRYIMDDNKWNQLKILPYY